MICGDWRQSYFKFEDEKVGFVNFKKILEKMPSFSCIEFGIEDIVRGKLVKEFLIEAYRQNLM
jgi:phosphate starvation-inducible PhoH-like protein